jgi:hypothetical protein
VAQAVGCSSRSGIFAVLFCQAEQRQSLIFVVPSRHRESGPSDAYHNRMKYGRKWVGLDWACAARPIYTKHTLIIWVEKIAEEKLFVRHMRKKCQPKKLLLEHV